MIGVFPISNETRRRIQRKQASDEPAGRDHIQPPAVVAFDPLKYRQNRKAEGLEPAALPSARNAQGCVLLMPVSAHHDLLDDVLLLHTPTNTRVERELTCPRGITE
jgi:hypothetical protein